jgi:hypothetical protein
MKIIEVIAAICITIFLLLFDIGCYFLQKVIYEYRKKGGSKYD